MFITSPLFCSLTFSTRYYPTSVTRLGDIWSIVCLSRKCFDCYCCQLKCQPCACVCGWGCVCVWGCKRVREGCVCVCVWEREREWERVVESMISISDGSLIKWLYYYISITFSLLFSSQLAGADQCLSIDLIEWIDLIDWIECIQNI